MTPAAALSRLEHLFSKRIDVMNDDAKKHEEQADEVAFTYQVSDEELEAVGSRAGRSVQTLESTAANCCRLDFVTDQRVRLSS